MDISTTPSLDFTCPQANTELDNPDHGFIERGADKTKYGHGSIMIIIITTSINHKTSHDQVTIHPQAKV